MSDSLAQRAKLAAAQNQYYTTIGRFCKAFEATKLRQLDGL